MKAQRKQLDPTARSIESQEFEYGLQKRIIGQPEAIASLVNLHQIYLAGMCPAHRPIGNLLFLGPTGAGKTHLVESAAEVLFGSSRAFIKCDCAEFQHSHEIAKLIGSPPGYLGHRETHPLITQEELAKYHTEKIHFSFLLFDEIEKASDALWKLLLGMLDKASLTLGDNKHVDLSQCIIILTSNLGGREITELMTGSLGFVQPKDKQESHFDEKVEKAATLSAKKKFSPEFMNRIDSIVVFRSLGAKELEQILDIEIGLVQERVLATAPVQFLLQVRPRAREFLLRDGTDIKYGARHLKRSIEHHLVQPMANLLATKQIRAGDVLRVDWNYVSDHLLFEREDVSDIT
jgi:ATP-dependent Clp protease ATP-binding subunit ClpB